MGINKIIYTFYVVNNSSAESSSCNNVTYKQSGELLVSWAVLALNLFHYTERLEFKPFNYSERMGSSLSTSKIWDLNRFNYSERLGSKPV